MSSNPILLDIHEIREVSIPVAALSSPDSGSSVGTGSPTLLTPASERDVRLSFCSSNGTPTVKFAPLPQFDPKRKRSIVPLGVSARSRRKQVDQEDLTWCTDPSVPETMEDPIITLAKFVKKTSQTLWRKLKKGNKGGPQGNVLDSAEPILDIRPIVLGNVAPGEKGHRMPDGADAEVKRSRRASWSPLDERRTLSQDSRAKRSSTSNLSPDSVA